MNFCITANDSPSLMVEVKWKDEALSSNFKIFIKFFPQIKMIQVTKELRKMLTFTWYSYPIIMY